MTLHFVGGRPRLAGVVWVAFVCAALLLLDVVDLTAYGVLVPLVAGAVWLAIRQRSTPRVERGHPPVDRRDLAVVAGLYLAIVVLFRIAFVGFGTERVAGLFISFAIGLLLGVAGPVVYTVWMRRRPLSSLGLSTERLGSTIGLGLLFAGIQFAMTLWGYDLPADGEEWVPLLAMSVIVGLFEAVFFRGFVQGRLEQCIGIAGSVAGAAALYALYHVGYGMGADEMVFLFGLGVVYAIAFRLVRNVLVVWPLLTPLGAFFNNLDSGDIDLPWASMIGFGEVGVAMVAVIWLAHRHERRRERAAITSQEIALVGSD